MTIDLHGLTEQEAIPEILGAFLSIDLGNYDEVEIITGNGLTLKRVLEDLASQEGFFIYQTGGNPGAYIVHKNKR